MNDSNSCLQCNGSNCLIKICDPDWIKLLSEKKQKSKYSKDNFIFRTGDYVSGLYFVKNGKVKVVSYGLNGKEQIVRLAANGHLLGHRGFGARTKETYPISAITMEDSEICFIDNDTIYEAFYNNVQFVIELMMFYSKELRALEARMTYMAQMTTREKTASALIYMKEIFGTEEDWQTLNININRREFASLCGTNDTQVIRDLSDFEAENLIAKEGKKIKIINETKLWEMIESYHWF